MKEVILFGVARYARKHAAGLLGAALASAIWFAPAAASARTITADQVSERSVIGGTSGCTLREAIQAINTRSNVNGCLAGDGNNDTIKLITGTYRVRLTTSGETLALNRPMTITGNGADVTKITSESGAVAGINLFRIGAGDVASTIQGIQIADVTTGHAILVSVSARLRFFYSSVVNCGNSAPGIATKGAVQNLGALTISSVDFFKTRGWISAGVYNSGSVYIENSSFVGATDAARVGALMNEGASASAMVFNTTFAKNGSGNQSTAINNALGGSMLLDSCTVYNNYILIGTWSSPAIKNDSSSTLRIRNTFISSNTNTGISGNPNCSGPITSLGNNYLGSFSPCPVAAPQPTDISGGSDGVDSTSDGFPIRKGGITRVYVPLPFTAVVARIPESECTFYDQRGLGRRDGSNCEIGAANRAHATLIVGNAASPSAEDQNMAQWLQSLGFDIYYHDDSWAAADFGNIGLTIGIISTSVDDATVGTKYRTTATGLVINKVSAQDNMEMVATNAYGTFNSTQNVQLPVVSDNFQLKIGNAAATTINQGGGGWGTPAGTAAYTYATYLFNNKPAIYRLAPGAVADGGFVMPGGRILFPGWPSFFTGSGTADGKNMFYEAVFWASRNRN